MAHPVLLVLFIGSFALQWRHPELAFHNAAAGLIVNVIWLFS